MKRRAVVLLGVAAVPAVLALASGGSGPDWPQWRGPTRTGVATGFAARSAWPEALRPAWKAEVGLGHSSPVVSDDRVYVFTRQGEDEVLQAFELATGKSLWRQAHPTAYRVNPAASSHGPRNDHTHQEKARHEEQGNQHHRSKHDPQRSDATKACQKFRRIVGAQLSRMLGQEPNGDVQPEEPSTSPPTSLAGGSHEPPGPEPGDSSSS